MKFQLLLGALLFFIALMAPLVYGPKTSSNIEDVCAYDPPIKPAEMAAHGEYNIVHEEDSLLFNPGDIPKCAITKVLPLESVECSQYPFIDGEYPYMKKDIIGILVKGENLSPNEIKVYSELTGDGWKWWHQGGVAVIDGLYFDLEGNFHYYTDPMGNVIMQDIGMDQEIALLSLYKKAWSKGKVTKVLFFRHRTDFLQDAFVEDTEKIYKTVA